jgi:hypothetical protein
MGEKNVSKIEKRGQRLGGTMNDLIITTFNFKLRKFNFEQFFPEIKCY